MVNQEPKLICLPIAPWSPAGSDTEIFALGGAGGGGLCIPWVQDVLQWLFKRLPAQSCHSLNTHVRQKTEILICHTENPKPSIFTCILISLFSIFVHIYGTHNYKSWIFPSPTASTFRTDLRSKKHSQSIRVVKKHEFKREFVQYMFYSHGQVQSMLSLLKSETRELWLQALMSETITEIE